MEHEVFVPVSVERLRAALADPERVARAVPGLHQDAGTAPIAGRLKVRVAGHSITYRGTLRVTGQDDGSFAIEGDATEARGSGSVKIALTIRLREEDEGTTLVFTGTGTADGRVTELPADAVAGAVTRLLSRFGEGLAETEAAEEGASAAGPDVPEAHEAPEAHEVHEEPEGPEGPTSSGTGASVYDTEGPSSMEPLGGEGFTGEEQPPAEAAHARRTMIGRSAEEVDHAPPRGRYAPVPAPESVSSSTALRWAVPAAVVAVASAVVAARALRRRR